MAEKAPPPPFASSPPPTAPLALGGDLEALENDIADPPPGFNVQPSTPPPRPGFLPRSPIQSEPVQPFPPQPLPQNRAPEIPGLPAPPLYNANIGSESTRVDRLGEELARDSDIWVTYSKAAFAYDAEMVDGWNKGLDVLLIFASLFSAVVTAFLIESTKLLQPDWAESQVLLTAHVLAVLAAQAQGTTLNTSFIANINSPAQILNYQPPTSVQLVNIMWYGALSLSLASVLVSMLAKQWLVSYMSEQTADPHGSACERQRRFDGVHNWGLPHIMAVLPALLHISLFLFLIGLIVSLSRYESKVSVITGVVIGILFLFYFTTGIIAIFDPNCPYITPPTQVIRSWLFPKKDRVVKEPNEVQASRAIMWLASGKEPRTVASALQSLAGLRRKYVGFDVQQTEYLANLALEHFRGCFIREWSNGGRFELLQELQWEASCYSRTLMNLIDDSRCGVRTFEVISNDEWLPQLLTLLGNCRNPSMAILALCDNQRLLHRREVVRWNSVRAPDGSHDKLQAGKFIKRTPGVENMKKIVEMLTSYTKADIFLHPYAIEVAVETMGFAPLAWIDAVSRNQSLESLLLPLLKLQFATREGGLDLRKAVACTLATFAEIHGMPRLPDADEDFAKRFEDSISIVASMEMADTTEDLTRELLLLGLAHFAGTEFQEGSTIQVGLIFESLFHETDRRTGNEDPWFSDSASVGAILPLLHNPNLRDDWKEKILDRLQANAVASAPGLNLNQNSFLHHITPQDPFPANAVDTLLSSLLISIERTTGWISDVAMVLSLISKGEVHRTRLLECSHLVMEVIDKAALPESSKFMFWIYCRAFRDNVSEPRVEVDVSVVLAMLSSYDRKHGLTFGDVELWVGILPSIPVGVGEQVSRQDLLKELLLNFQMRSPEVLARLAMERETVLGESSTLVTDAAVRALHQLEVSYAEGLEVKDDASTPQVGSDGRENEWPGYTYPPTTLLPMYEVNPLKIRQNSS